MRWAGPARRGAGASASFPRQPASAPLARRFVRNALGAVPSDAVERLLLATAEAVNNAIDHASGPRFTVRVLTNDTNGVVAVVDAGHGFAVPPVARMPPADHLSGRGLALIHRFVDHAEVASSPAGTIVTLVQQLAPAPVPGGHRPAMPAAATPIERPDRSRMARPVNGGAETVTTTDSDGNPAELLLREQLRQEMAAMATVALASRVRWGIRQVRRHPNQPVYRIRLDAYATELKRRTGVEIIHGPLPPPR